MPRVGFEPTISAGERPKTYALDRAATGTGNNNTNNNNCFYWRYNPLWVCILQPCSGAIASSRTRFLDHTQRRATVGRTPLDE